MSLAITDDHRALAETAADFLTKRDARAASRALLDGAEETLPELWGELTQLGWLGLHLPEEYGGSGYGLEELAVVVEQLGRADAPGPFVPTVIVSALIAAAADDATKAAWLPRLADGSLAAAAALDGDVAVEGGTATGSAGVVLGGALAGVFLVATGDDVAIVEVGDGVIVDVPTNLDPTRRSAKVTLDGAPATVIPGARQALVDLTRLVLSAEAIGLALECTDMAAAYAKERVQFGRVIGTYQAVKHHCANMVVATELATSAVWDAAKAAATGGDQLTLTAAVAATLAAPAADLCANLNTQVHGGIAITWEHDAHLYMRRATTLLSFLRPADAAADLTDLTRRGVSRGKQVELPPEAEPIRDEVRAFAESISDLPEDQQRARLIETGYVMPHWPKPYGRAAGAVEQLVVEQEFERAGVQRPSYGITAWNILTLIQYATPDQLERWVLPALNQEVIWCQLFSEPDAGSDAAGVKTKATRVDGGWLVNGQKVWTSGAHVSGMGFATVRTNPDVPKHDGITTMVIDMHAPGVEVRPLKMTIGASEFNEVFFDDVFVPDEMVVGTVDDGWRLARTTLANERVAMAQGTALGNPVEEMLRTVAQQEIDTALQDRVGELILSAQVGSLLDQRIAQLAVGGQDTSAEASARKLIGVRHRQSLAELRMDLTESAGAVLDRAVHDFLNTRCLTIAGGTEQILLTMAGERLLGLPR